jgi:eukaryotic-like serine/threonine-protein kinase
MPTVILRIQEGSEEGKEHPYEEAINLVVGRKDPGSQANIQVYPDDHSISRHHFRLEIRPPAVMVQDINSTNGTFVQRKGTTVWQRITEVLLSNGDQIKAGNAIFGFEIIEKSPAAKDSEPLLRSEWSCIRCGKPLDRLPNLQDGFTDNEFMCRSCQVAIRTHTLKEVAVKCSNCSADMSRMANSDGRAAELAGEAQYLCNNCAGAASDLIGVTIGEYQSLSLLGKGGIGEVYKVRHRRTGRLAALKLLLAAILQDKDELAKNRFFREAAIMDELKHPGLTRLYEMGNMQGVPYFVSEYVAGGNLGQFAKPKGIPVDSFRNILGIIVDTLEALHNIHMKGYVHRDIKPENILISVKYEKIFPKVVDFGLARSFQQHGGTYSMSGNAAGTPPYMAIEQLMNFKDSQPTVDIYSTGVVLYYLLSGHFPLSFPSPHDPPEKRLFFNPIRLILEEQPKPISHWRSDLPLALMTVADRAVRKFAAERFGTAAEFREELLKAI